MPSPGRKPLSGRIASTKRDRQGRRLPGFRSSVLLGLAFVLLLASLIFVYLQLPKDNDGDLKFKAQDIWAGREGLRLLDDPPSRTFCDRESTPHVCAHGGDPQTAPANTMRSFKAAVTAGYECVEVDVVLSADGIPVVLHVRELRSLLAYAGDIRPDVQVGDLTMDELSALQWPDGDGVHKAQDVIAAVQDGVQTVILDVKTYNDLSGKALDEDRVTMAVVQLVKATSCNNCLIWAKSDAVVQQVKRHLPHQRTGYVVMNETAAARADGMDRLLRLEAPEVAAVHHAMLDPGALMRLHRAGKQGYGWTADQPQMMRQLLDVGVDAIVTSHPQRLKKAILIRRQHCRKDEM